MKVTTRIPTRLNDGRAVSVEVLGDIRRMIADQFGGVSVDGPGQGAWIGEDGRMYDEASYVVTFATERIRYAEARNLVIKIGQMLEQEAMYFEVQYFDGVEIIDTR